jgi:hypothetical protein
MPYLVECPCGQRIEVEAWSAGGTVPCPCGQAVPVPLLSELRRDAGLDAYQENPARKIERMRAAGELPAGTTCARCDDPTDEVLELVAECETGGKGPSDVAMGVTAAFAALFGSLFLAVAAAQSADEGETRGGAVSVLVPVRLCRECRRQLLWRKFGRVIRYAVIGLIAGGLLAAYLWSAWFFLLLPVAAILGWVSRRLWRREQIYLQASLRQVPVYRELFERYPSAEISPA